jgi:hypothetical protein
MNPIFKALWPLAVLVAVLVAGAIALGILKQTGLFTKIVRGMRGQGAEPVPKAYTLLPGLLSATERAFLAALEGVPRDGVDIYAKVRVADVIGVRDQPDRSHFLRLFNPIAMKHFDYVLVRRSDARPLAAIELDDKSHRQADRAERDLLLNRVTKEAGIPLIRFAAAASYSSIALNDRLASVLAAAAKDPPANRSPSESRSALL